MYHAYSEIRESSLSYQKKWNMAKKLKQVEMNFSMTMQESVEQVKATEVVIKTILTMIQIKIYLMLATVKVCLHVQVCDQVLLMRRLHHQCPEKPLSTIDITTAVVRKRLPPLQSHAFEWVHDWVRVIAALRHAIGKVEKPSLDDIRRPRFR